MLIGQLARLCGLSKDGIRHYEEVGVIRSTERRAGNRVYREYDVTAVTRIEQARQAQQLGLSLKEIGPILDAYSNRAVTEAESISFLEERLAVIRGKLDELRRVESFISEKLERYRTRSSDGG